MMEALYPPATVEHRYCSTIPDCSSHPSRSVPVFGIGEKGFQLARFGKYQIVDSPSFPEVPPVCRDGVAEIITSPEGHVEGSYDSLTTSFNVSSQHRTTGLYKAVDTPALSGTLEDSICPSEARHDTAPPLSPCILQANNYDSHYCHLTRTSQDHSSIRSGNARHSICPAEASNDTTQHSCAYNFQPNCDSTTAAYKLRVYYQNVRGLRTKIDDLFLAATDSDYDVIVFTETWLNDQIFSSQLFGGSYTVFRNDRNHLNSQKSRGGGVLIAVSTNLNCYLDPTPVDASLEQLWIQIKLSNRSVSIGVIYLPPDRKTDMSSITRHINSIEAIFSRNGVNDQALLYGDYNQSGLVWNSDNGHPTLDSLQSHISVACAALLDGFSLHGLTQINTIANRNGRFLDLALVNDKTLEGYTLCEAAEPLSILDADHPPFVVEINVTMDLCFENPPDRPGFDFHRADFEGMLEALNHTDWGHLNFTGDVDESVDHFTSVINNITADYVPLRGSNPKPVWGNAHLRHLKQLRSKALRKYCRSRNVLTKQMFSQASNRYRTYNCFLYKRYTLRMQENLRRNPKSFWKFVNSKRTDLDNDKACFR